MKLTVRRAAAAVAAALLVSLLPMPASAEPTITEGTIQSFDGTHIAYTLFLPDAATAEDPVPVVFNGHGWGGTRTRTATGLVGTILDAGYAVLTWDARGFGHSGGVPQTDSQEYEVRDVQALMDFVADQPGIQTDAPGDPRMGMIGPSYAGGIQLMTASADTRVDAIVPQIPWNDLVQSLRPGGVLRLQWDVVLYGAGLSSATTAGLSAPQGPEVGGYPWEIHQSFIEGVVLNDWSDETVAWFDARSPKHYINGTETLPGIQAPMLIQQGVNDTLFPLNEGTASFDQVRANGVDAKLQVFCGGHSLYLPQTSCVGGDLVSPASEFLTESALAWFDRYLRGDTSVDTGATVDYQLQDGSWASIDALPEPSVTAAGSGLLVNQIVPTSGTVIGGTSAPDGIRIPVDVEAGSTLLGNPTATVGVTGVGVEAFLFFKLIDAAPDGSRTVIDDQVMAKKVTDLSDEAQVFELDLAGVSWSLGEAHTVELEISSTSADHASSRFPSLAEVEVTVAVPVV